MINKPNFICVGAQKAGTTSLHDILKQHTDIYLPELKEAHFFDDEKRYKKGIKWWIDTFFNKYNNEKIMGVMTPEYLYFEEVPGMIVKDLGSDIKIIIILRNPVDRAYSHYLMSVRRGFEEMTFKEAIEKESTRIIQGEFERNNFSYIDRGLYTDQIKRYMENFGNENILFLSFEKDIINNINSTIKKIEVFLDIEKIELNTNIKSNPASKPRFKFINNILYKKNLLRKILKYIIKSDVVKLKIAQWLSAINQKPTLNNKLSIKQKKEIFKQYYEKDITRLEKLLNKNFDEWKYND